MNAAKNKTMTPSTSKGPFAVADEKSVYTQKQHVLQQDKQNNVKNNY